MQASEVQDLYSTTPYTPSHLLCLFFFQILLSIHYISPVIHNTLLYINSLISYWHPVACDYTCAVNVRTRSLQMDVESLHCFKGNVNISPIALSHAYPPAHFRLCYPFYDESCLNISSLCCSQAPVMPESSLAALIP